VASPREGEALMTWFKVDDKLHDHRKVRAAGKAAMGVWVLAGSWAADNLTDGFIPTTVLPRWGTRADANKLVTAGLWHTDEQDGEKGWRFHQWNEAGRQPTRAEKLAERAARAEAGRIGGQASGRSRRGAKSVATAKQSASPDVEPPSRPVPSAAAAAGGELPVAVEILRKSLEAHKLLVRWDILDPTELAEIEELVATHGDGALVSAALREFQPAKPAATARAWLPGWRQLTAPGDLALVRQQTCPTHGTRLSPSGACSSCAADQKAKTS
jgi:hypothetical protein